MPSNIFLCFKFKPERRNSSEMFVVTKWMNQILFEFGLPCAHEIKCVQQF